ncbi:MAG: DUF6503 family protein, partial [Bacteroidota bacterium]
MKLFLLICLLAVGALVWQSCSSAESVDQAQTVVDAAIKAHGADQFAKSQIEFTFRNRQYRATRDGGQYTYERIWEDTTGMHHDSLFNDGFTRHINGELVAVEKKKVDAYSNSINSVVYFAQLPYFLNDGAVIKEYLGTSTIKGESYDKVKVTFEQAGGGK